MRIFCALLGLASGMLTPLGLASPADAVGETCDGQAATIVGAPGATLTGTEGPDVIVSAGALRIEALGGDDVICTTGSTRQTDANLPASVTVQAGPGNDVVDRRGDLDLMATGNVYPGPGADTVLGAPGSEYVGAGDGEADVVQTFGGDDQVSLALVAGGPADPDTVDLGTGDDSFNAPYPFSPSLSVVAGEGQDHLDIVVTVSDAWTVDAAAGEVRTQAGTVFAFGGFERFSIYADLHSHHPAGDVTFLGTDADESLQTSAGRVTARLGGGDDSAYVTDFWNRGVDIDAGPGHDQIRVDGVKRAALMVDLRRGQLRERLKGFNGFRGPIKHFEHAEVIGGLVDVVGTGRANTISAWGCRGVTVHAGGGADVVRFRPVEPDDITCHAVIRLRLFGEGGADALTGGPFADLLVGGPGRDRAVGRAGRDTCRAEVRRGCERR